MAVTPCHSVSLRIRTAVDYFVEIDDTPRLLREYAPVLYEWLCAHCSNWELDLIMVEVLSASVYHPFEFMTTIVIQFFDQAEAALFILFEPVLLDP